jgi:hypothetical protein
MLSDERRKEIEQEERAQAAEEAYRREVRSSLSPSGSHPEQYSFSTSNYDAEESSDFKFWLLFGAAIVLFAIGYMYFTDSNGATQTANSQGATTASRPRQAVRVPVADSIYSGQITVPAGSVIAHRFRVVPGMENPRLVGRFVATGGSRNDVEVILTTEAEYTNWSNGHAARGFYSSGGRKTTDSFTINLSDGEDEYYFGMSNRFSILSPKYVYLDLKLHYDRLQMP